MMVRFVGLLMSLHAVLPVCGELICNQALPALAPPVGRGLSQCPSDNETNIFDAAPALGRSVSFGQTE